MGLLDQIQDPAMRDQISSLMGGGQLSDEDKKYARQQGLLNFAAHALMNMYKPTGQGIGAGLAGGLQGYNEAQQTVRRNKLVDAENMQKAIQTAQGLQGLNDQYKTRQFESGYKPPSGPQMPSMAPTIENAAVLASAPKMTTYEKLMHKAEAAQAAGLDPSRYLAEAEKHAPKYKGMETVMGPDGKPMLLQTYDNQAPSPVQGGYGPKPDIQFLSLGGRTEAVDKLRAQGGQSFAHTFTPEGAAAAANAAAHLKLSQDAANRDKGEQYGTPIQITGEDGETQLMVPRKGTNQVVPMTNASGQPVSKSASIPQKYKDTIYNLNNLEAQLKSYNKELASFSTGTYFSPDAATRLMSKYASLKMDMKNLYELGALAGPDVAILGEGLTDPASIKGFMLPKSHFEAQTKVIEDRLKASRENIAKAYNQHGNKKDDPLGLR